jgi:hypothetical protein
MFNMGFELIHAFMGVDIQKKSSYEEAFARVGLRVERCVPFGAPNTFLYVLMPEDELPSNDESSEQGEPKWRS